MFPDIDVIKHELGNEAVVCFCVTTDRAIFGSSSGNSEECVLEDACHFGRFFFLIVITALENARLATIRLIRDNTRYRLFCPIQGNTRFIMNT